jgi:hypothetical protein
MGIGAAWDTIPQQVMMNIQAGSPCHQTDTVPHGTVSPYINDGSLWRQVHACVSGICF